MPLPAWMRRKRIIALGMILTLFVAYFATCKIMDPRIEPTPGRVDEAMELAVDFFESHTLENGRFIYEVNSKGESSTQKYNVLRHAGSIYSLSMYYRQVEPLPEVRELILRTARYLIEKHVAPVEGLPGRTTIFSLVPEEEGRERSAKLGAAGLGLIALVRARSLDEDLIGLDVLRQIGEFILFMQQPDGSFRSKYSETKHFEDDFDSLYYPGEAILALTELYEVDRDKKWLDAALLAVRSLIDRQRAMDEVPPDHWQMIATGKLVTLMHEAASSPVTKEEMFAHTVTIGLGMIKYQELVELIPGLMGAFGGDGRSTPSSTRLEGLIAVHRVLPDDHWAKLTFERAIYDGIGFLLACQNQGGPNKGGFREAYNRTFGGKRYRYVRNDYVQHALSALIGCRESICS